MALIALLVAIGAVRGAAVAARHRTEAIADAAALAAAGRIGLGTDTDICGAAAATATAAGARVTLCRPELGVDGRSGTVTVAVTRPVSIVGVGGAEVSAWSRAGRVASHGSSADRGGTQAD
ncbi:MAG: hypothetical protein JO147_09380 [Actinobacteria bacterium]|nr:hypothetical protein [Actinomycetota bacterium]